MSIASAHNVTVDTRHIDKKLPSRSERSHFSKTINAVKIPREMASNELSKYFGIENEPLLKQYSCALHKDGSILQQGKMYITPLCVYFYSNILGWETKLSISFDEITSITKQKTALLFSNAITITTTDKEYFLTSFMHRNNAYRVLQLVWKYSMKGIQLTKKELSQLVDELKQSSESSVMSRGDTPEERGEEGDDCYTDGPPKRRREELMVYTTTTTPPSSDSPPSNSVDDDFNSQKSETTLTEIISNETESSKESLLTSSNNGEVVTNGITTNYQKANGSSLYIDTYHKESFTGFLLNSSPAAVINVIIGMLIVLLLISMLSLICKLCEMDPNLKQWLLWQPWCVLVCSHSPVT